MATLHEIEVIIAEFTEKYRREEFSKIRKSSIEHHHQQILQSNLQLLR